MFRLIPAAREDIDIIAPMVDSLYIEDEGLGMIDSNHIGKTFDFLLANPGFGTICLITADEVIGYTIIVYWWSNEFGGLVAILDELYIKPEFRNRHYGTRTIRDLQAMAADRGVKRMILEVDKGNDRAKRLYESLGFKATGRHHLITSID